MSVSKNCVEKKKFCKKEVYAHVTPMTLCSRMGKISTWQEKPGIAYERTEQEMNGKDIEEHSRVAVTVFMGLSCRIHY